MIMVTIYKASVYMYAYDWVAGIKYGYRIFNWRNEYNNFFCTKDAAISRAESKFHEQPINESVKHVHAEVTEYTITDEGIKRGQRVYNLIK
jgi:hypothetical protein